MRSNQNPENAVARSIPVSDSWRPNLTGRQFGQSVGHPTHLKGFVCGTSDFRGAWFEVKRNRSTCWSRSCVAMLTRGDGSANGKIPYRSVVFSSCILFRAARISSVPVHPLWRVSSSPRPGDFSVLVCGAQRASSRAGWRADECCWKASQQQNTSIDLR